VTLTDALIDEIRAEFPEFRVVPKKNDRLSWLIDRLLKVATLGHQDQYLTHYYTVIFHTLYTPEGWETTGDIERVITLRHERVHLRQLRRYTAPGMVFLYLLPFAPLGLAYGRARLEWEAYTETVRATAELRGLAAARSEHLRRHILKQFTSGAYGWMWPFEGQLNRWYDEALGQIEREIAGTSPRAARMEQKG
jgi:hypothetical protein